MRSKFSSSSTDDGNEDDNLYVYLGQKRLDYLNQEPRNIERKLKLKMNV